MKGNNKSDNNYVGSNSNSNSNSHSSSNNNSNEHKSNLALSNDNYEVGAIEQFFYKQKINFEVLGDVETNTLFEEAKVKNIFSENFVRAQLVYDDTTKYLIVADINKVIDYKLLCENINENIRHISPDLYTEKDFYNSVVDSYVPIPDLLHAKGIVDTSLDMSKDIYLVTSNYYHQNKDDKDNMDNKDNKDNKYINRLDNLQKGKIIKIKGSDFNKIQQNSSKCKITYPLNKLNIKRSSNGNILFGKFSEQRIKARILETQELPIIPVMATELLFLRVNVNAQASDLAKIIEKDPSLCAQLISWACSPFYGFRGKITSVQDAIIKVLGYDLVMNISLGIAISKAMKVPYDGAIGLREFWRHSIYSALLVENLIKLMPFRKKPHKDLAYLCGLLHNFGHLLLGELFPPHFKLLNQTIELNRDVSVIHLEEKIFETNHQQMGAWLMEAWHLPKELIITNQYHHKEDYFDEHSIYVNLVYISDYLLSKKGIGDHVHNDNLSKAVLENVGFSQEQAFEVLETLIANSEKIDSLVNSLHD